MTIQNLLDIGLLKRWIVPFCVDDLPCTQNQYNDNIETA